MTSVSKYSRESSFKNKVISVPLPNVFPRGSGKISNSLSSALELKMCWTGLGFFSVFGPIEAT